MKNVYSNAEKFRTKDEEKKKTLENVEQNTFISFPLLPSFIHNFRFVFVFCFFIDGNIVMVNDV